MGPSLKTPTVECQISNGNNDVLDSITFANAAENPVNESGSKGINDRANVIGIVMKVV
jgi:hypothetical protein